MMHNFPNVDPAVMNGLFNKISQPAGAQEAAAAAAPPPATADAVLRLAMERAAVTTVTGGCRCTTCLFIYYSRNLEDRIRELMVRK
jgi:hypothetical protein